MATTRRTFVKAGIGGAATLAGGYAGPLLGQASPLTPFVLLVYASGGWDPTMVFDNKIGSGYVTQEPGATAATGAGNIRFVGNASRPAVTTFFNAYGGNAAIINGLHVGSMDRKNAIYAAMSVTPPGKTRPVDWLSYYAASLNPVLEIPHAVIDAPYIPGDYTSVGVRITKKIFTEHNVALEGADALGDAGEAALLAFRKTAYASFYKTAASASLDGEKLRALYYGFAREPIIASNMQAVAASLGDQGTDSDYVRAGKMAVDLFASGKSLCATVQAGRTGLWETAVDHLAQGSANFEMLFSGLSTIMAHAQARGVLDKMTVVVMSEMGREPRLNAQGGKGPWPYTSMMVWGPGVNGGTVVGLTDPALRGLPIDPVFGGQTGAGAVTLEPAHVFAALYLRYSVPVKLVLPNHKPLSQVILAEARQ